MPNGLYINKRYYMGIILKFSSNEQIFSKSAKAYSKKNAQDERRKKAVQTKDSNRNRGRKEQRL
jgi:hypothetical protein